MVPNWTIQMQIDSECPQTQLEAMAIQFIMMTSSHGNIFYVTGYLCGNSPVPREFPAQRPVTQSLDVFFDLCLNKWLSKQSWGWWFETLSHPLWSHCNVHLKLNYLWHPFQLTNYFENFCRIWQHHSLTLCKSQNEWIIVGNLKANQAQFEYNMDREWISYIGNITSIWIFFIS